MIEIIPAILEQEFSEVAKKIKQIQKEAPKTKWAQLDIMDNNFVPNRTWMKARDLAGIKTKLKFEVHLMVEKPDNVVRDWLKQESVQRILIHQETVRDDAELLELSMLVQEAGREVGIVLNPETSIETIEEHLVVLDEVMCMGVVPGFSGQSFEEDVFDKIQALRTLDHAIPIAIDGGVNQETAPRLIKAGATRLCSASYLWNQDNLQTAIDSLLLTVI